MIDQYDSFPDIHAKGRELRQHQEDFDRMGSFHVIKLRCLFALQTLNVSPELFTDVQAAIEDEGLSDAPSVVMHDLQNLYLNLRERGWSHDDVVQAARK